MLKKAKRLYAFGPFTLNATDCILSCGGREIKLEPKVFELLDYFVSHPGEILSRDQIKLAVWGTENLEDNNVDQKLVAIRRVFLRYARSRDYIETFPKRGWRFAAKVTEHFESPLLGAPPETGGLASTIVAPNSSNPPLEAPPVLRAQTSTQLVEPRHASVRGDRWSGDSSRRGTMAGEFRATSVATAGSLEMGGQSLVRWSAMADTFTSLREESTRTRGHPRSQPFPRRRQCLLSAQSCGPTAMIMGIAQITQDRLYSRWTRSRPLLFVWRRKPRLLEPPRNRACRPHISGWEFHRLPPGRTRPSH